MGNLYERLARSRKIFALWSCMLAIGIILNILSPGPDVKAKGLVRFYYFYDPNCDVCHVTHEEVVEPLLDEFDSQVEVTELSVAEPDNMELLIRLEKQFGVTGGDIPEVVIGDDVLVGYFEIQDSLPERIEYYMSQGGIDLPTLGQSPTMTPTVSAIYDGCDICDTVHGSAVTQEKITETPSADDAPIHAVYFYQPGCDECERAEHDLAYVWEKYPQVQIERLNVKDNAAFNQYLCEETGVPENKHLTAPALFIGHEYLLDREVRAGAIEDIIAELGDEGSPAWWVGWEAQREQVEQSILSRFESFGLLTVVGAGLLDGVNPCAFATMIFLISYLSFNNREGKQLLFTGAAFTSGVFLTYLGVGFGFLKFLASLPFLHVIGKWIYGLTAILCLALAWGSIQDYCRAREGRLQDMSLKLPDNLRELSKKLIRKGTSARRFVLSTFVIGLGVSLVELACTGQVYLPTIIYVLGMPGLRARATLALLLYNLMFIVPLIGVFLLAYFGTTSEELIDLLNQHAPTVKIGMTVLFVALAGWLLYSIVAF